MRVGLLLLLALIGILSITSTLAHIEPDDSEADDFAEFDDFDEDNENENGAAPPKAQAHPKAAVEEDDFDDEVKNFIDKMSYEL